MGKVIDVKKIVDSVYRHIERKFEIAGFDPSFFTWRIIMEYMERDGEQEKYIKDHIGMYSNAEDMKLK